MEINHKNIVLTGATSGIGLSVLQELLKFDCKIVAAGRNADYLEKIALLNIDRVIPFVGDLSNPDQIDQLFSFAKSSLGSIDIFIANAGFAYYEQLKSADWNHIDQIFKLNTLSPIYSLLKMQEIHSGADWKTVMICSAMGEWMMPGYALYGATKAAINHFSEGYRFDNRNNNLMVVYPIATQTRFFERAGKQIPIAYPVQSAESVARKIVRGISHDRKKVYPSGLFRFILIINRILPFIKPIYQSLEKRKFTKWLKSNLS